MKPKRIAHLTLMLLLLFALLAACRREEEQLPTPVPTIALPTPRPTNTRPPAGEGESNAVTEPIPALNAADITWPPQLIDSRPLPGEELLPDGAITLRFDQPMDQASVEEALRITAVDGDTAVAGTFTWTRPDTVRFTPQSPLKDKQLYRVNITDAAQGANGLALPVPIELQLETAGPLAVNQVLPADGAEGIATDGAITVVFNRPVVPLVSGGQQELLPQPLLFDPPADGRGEWTSTSIYRFLPDPPLAGATAYRVAVDPDLTDVVGMGQETPFTFSFTTLSPDVVTVSPAETQPLTPNTTLTLTFNMPMDAASTETAVSLSGTDAPDVTLAYTWSPDGRELGLTPEENLELETTYDLTVGAGAAAASGQATLGQPQIFTYQTYPFPAVVSVYPRRGTTAEFYDRGVNITFASPMDWDTVEGRVQIFPAPANPRYFINPFANEVQIDFPLAPDTTYNVTVPGTAADPYGNTLGNSYTWEFDTPGTPPLASFNLPPNQSLLSTSVANEVDIIYSNVSQIDVSLHNLGLPLNLFNRPWDITDYRPASEPLRTWEIPIEGGRNEVNAYALSLADGRALPTGIYLLALAAPDLTEDARWWQNQRNMLIVADTNVVVKEMFGDVFAWTTDIGSGRTVGGRNLALYSAQGVEIGTAVSDDNGFARFDYYPSNDYLEGVTVVSGTPGEAGFGVGNSQWNGGAAPWQFGLGAASQDEAAAKAYLYTDRPIYRPGDTLHYKGIVRRANYGRYELTSQLDLELIIRFNNFTGESFEDRIAVTVRPDGTFSGDYPLPEGASLGTYQLALESPLFGFEAYREFTVAEYRRPEFLVTLTPETPAALRGETVDVVLQAEYFFGGSAAGLPVEWNLYEETYFPDFPGPYYCWTDCANFYYEDPGLFFGGFGDRFLGSGSGETDANGRLAITLPANLLRQSDEGSRVVNIEATVQDISGFPISSRTSVTFHGAETYVGIQAANRFVAAGEEMAVSLKTVDWEGTAVPDQPVEVTFYRREWEPVRTQEFGQYYTAWQATDTEVERVSVTTGDQGEAEASFVPESGGTYLAVATVTDGDGRINLSSLNLWVTDDGRIAWQTDPNDHTMNLVPDQQEYAVGDTASVLVQNPFDVPVQAWVVLERGNLLLQRVVTLQPNSDVLQIPITENYAPNVFVTVTAVKPLTPDSEDPYASIRLGITELVVPPAPFTLDVSLAPRQTTLEPRDTAVFDILTTDEDGAPVAADLSLALVDLAVLTLKQDNAPHIVDYFYAQQPYRSQTGGGLFISGEGLPLEVPVQGGGLGGGGGDGVAEESIALAEDEEDDDVRRDFPDTAYWEANLTTGSDGRATVEIPLPDTLTTWRLHGKASTPDTLVGQNSADIVTTLPLLIRPVTPRFLTVGDVLQIGAVLNNNTGAAIEATASLEAAGVSLNSPAEQTVTVPANGQTLVRWETAVDEATFEDGQAFADFTFRAEGGGYSDATKPGFGVGPDNLIPIVRFNAQDVVGSAGELSDPGRVVEAILLPPGVDMDQGSVDAVLSPSLAAALLDSLALHNNQATLSSCPAALADELLPNVAVATLLERVDVPEVAADVGAEVDTIIQTDINALTQLVLPDGGWGWCSREESDPWISAYAALGLTKARQIGYDVPEALVENAGNYLVSELNNPASLREATEANRQAFFLYVLAEMGAAINAELDALFDGAGGLLDPYGKGLLLLAYARTNGSPGNVQTLLSQLNDTAAVSATGAHWEDAGQDYANLSSDIRGTAMVIQALALHAPDNVLAPPAVRWLMVARTAGHWPAAHETAWSIFGLAEWLAATGELDASYDYGLQVNLRPVADGRFTRETITDSRQVTVPVPNLAETEPNFFEIRRSEGDGRLYYTLHMHTAVDASQVGPLDRGIHVERAYYDAACDPETETCHPITEIEVGQQVRVVVTIQAENDLLYPLIEDPIPAGAEAVDPNLETTPSDQEGGPLPRYNPAGFWGWWAFERVEYRDDKVVFLAEFLPAGTYQYTYYLNPIIPGTYQVMPTFAREAYFPEVNGRAGGLLFTIAE